MCWIDFWVEFSWIRRPLGWLVPAEIFPLNVRSKGIGVSTATNWIFNFGVGLATPVMLGENALNTWGTFLLFSAFLVVMFFFILFFLPETKGRSLERMQELFDVQSWKTLRVYTKERMMWFKEKRGPISDATSQSRNTETAAA